MMNTGLSQWLTVYHCLTGDNHFTLSHFKHLLNNIGSPAVILETSASVYEKAGMSDGFCRAIRHVQRGRSSVLKKVEADLEWLQAADHHILVADDGNYPALLSAIPDPPPLLYVKGNAEALNTPVIAMVGSRKPSPSGRRLARRFSRELAACGVTISSGLAYGIDSESHRGTLDAGGKTAAVLGSGLHRIYPRAHESLADEIVQSAGCLVSEFPLGFEPRAWCFPMRNRLITGLSRGVLVVEAALKSGSLISARYALEQGREVYAIPGPVDAHQSRGCNHLIREGACLVESAQDILCDWNEFPVAMASGTIGSVEANAGTADGDSDQEKQILAALESGEQSVDALVELTGRDAPMLTVILGELEVRGLVSRQGSFYCKER